MAECGQMSQMDYACQLAMGLSQTTANQIANALDLPPVLLANQLRAIKGHQNSPQSNSSGFGDEEEEEENREEKEKWKNEQEYLYIFGLNWFKMWIKQTKKEWRPLIITDHILLPHFLITWNSMGKWGKICVHWEAVNFCKIVGNLHKIYLKLIHQYILAMNFDIPPASNTQKDIKLFFDQFPHFWTSIGLPPYIFKLIKTDVTKRNVVV
jgi:hypothetical protein